MEMRLSFRIEAQEYNLV